MIILHYLKQNKGVYENMIENNENFKEFVSEVTSTLSRNSIPFNSWKKLTSLYFELMERTELDVTYLNKFKYSLFVASVHTVGETEVKEHELILSNLLDFKYSVKLDEVNKYILLIKSRVESLVNYSKRKVITVDEWLKLYDDFISTYQSLIDVEVMEAHVVLKEYSNVLKAIRVSKINNIDEMNYSYRMQQLKAI